MMSWRPATYWCVLRSHRGSSLYGVALYFSSSCRSAGRKVRRGFCRLQSQHCRVWRRLLSSLVAAAAVVGVGISQKPRFANTRAVDNSMLVVFWSGMLSSVGSSSPLFFVCLVAFGRFSSPKVGFPRLETTATTFGKCDRMPLLTCTRSPSHNWYHEEHHCGGSRRQPNIFESSATT